MRKVSKRTGGRSVQRTILGLVIAITVNILFGSVALGEEKDWLANISFSHDGKKILFDRARDKRPARIHVYDLETGELGLYRQPEEEEWTMARYSYDGRHIVFVITPFTPTPKVKRDLANMQVAMMDPDGKNLKFITKEPGVKIYPSFSHSGKKILFGRAEIIREKARTPAAGYDLYEVDVVTSVETRLTRFRFYQMSPPSYLPDDQSLLFEAYGPTRALDEADGLWKPIKSKDDAWRKKYGTERVYLLRREQTVLEPHLNTELSARHPLISANGEIFLFETQAYKLDGRGDWAQFFMFSRDGQHKRITNLKSRATWSAAISPDGRSLGIVYDEKDPKKRSLVVYDVQDGTSRRINLPAEARYIN